MRDGNKQLEVSEIRWGGEEGIGLARTPEIRVHGCSSGQIAVDPFFSALGPRPATAGTARNE